ncbi:FAD-binding oxidoreductase [Allokutzneria multivorans]|uniref:FAD-binding oxidoreductase n=1 Tax=Allokutzneria multivorans TaxID=1142134 RepID=A0ABP7TW88_9PSEU
MAVTEIPTETRTLTGWGRTAPTTAKVVSTGNVDEIARAVRTAGQRGVIARGLGRSYGDSSQNAGGLVIDMTALDKIHAINVDEGVVEVDSGVSLDTLVRRLLPYGLWVPVLPGTRQVTVGGAIAADVHGGNHHTQGSFCNHVLSMDVVTANGEIQRVTPDGDNAELFWATAGGMGLTGIVLRATIRLKRVETSYFLADVEQTDNFDQLLERLQDNDDQYTYSKSWFDSLTTGERMGRGTLLRGWPAKLEDLPKKLRKDPLKFDAPQLLTVPDIFPNWCLNKLTAKIINEAYYRMGATRFGAVQNITQFFHPLDLVGEWNRGYGSNGFLQYQFVVPFGQEPFLRSTMETISSSGHISCLNVLKRFGAGNSGHISFPEPGWTLAMDLPIKPGLHQLCDELDERVLAAGGRLYLAKESRTRAETIEKMYPRIDEWRKVRAAVDPEGVFASDQSRRLAL